MLQVLNTVFVYEGEEWVADNSMLLTSNPPKYNCYRLSDKKHMYLETMEVSKYPIVRFMYPHDLYTFLNPGAGTTFTLHGPTGTITTIEGNTLICTTPETKEIKNDKKD